MPLGVHMFYYLFRQIFRGGIAFKILTDTTLLLAKLYQLYSIYNNIWYYQVLKIFFKLIDMIYISLIVRAVVHFIFIGHLYFIFSEVTHWILSWFSYCVVFFDGPIWVYYIFWIVTHCLLYVLQIFSPVFLFSWFVF